MDPLCERLHAVELRVRDACLRFGRDPGSVTLLAVSKTRPAGDVRAARACGQRLFGENYVQEAVEKAGTLADLDLQWHFIGRIQSNKTRAIASYFDWVHSIDSPKHARRLSEQRPDGLPPLEVCLQVSLDGEPTKGGLSEAEVEPALEEVRGLPRLRLRGLMTLPPATDDFEAQRRPFRRLRDLRDRLASAGLPLDTLSMGMTGDLEAAIAEGSTLVRVGTGVFGPRD
ncbi:MAG: YggS family pyridoxal phosphate-dependent enzyme [Chromatiales bacterium]|jgi:pyridoxal phosphate enzyme (YggS family)